MKKAVVFGAGNIGRGLAGRIFSESGYEVVFVDVNKELLTRINEAGCYPLYVTKGEGYDKRVVGPVRAIDGRDMDAICNETDSCDIAATACGVNVLPIIAKSVAAVIRHRCTQDNPRPLNFILCENKIDVHVYMKELLFPLLNEKESEYAKTHIGLLQSSIGCMVPAPSPALLAENPLIIAVENYNKIYTDKSGAVGELPDISALIAYEPFDFYIKRKLYMHNMSHCVLAYHGYKKGYKYVYEAIADKEIRDIVRAALRESAIALAKAYGQSADELYEHGDDLITRYGNKLLGDTLARVGADPKRKLSRADRLTGAALFCLENGVFPEHIIPAIILGFSFNPENDPTAPEIAAYINENGFEKSIEKYCGLSSGEELYKLIVARS
ncbi:MAG: hypothetical protein VB118_02570 [Oscillospiraceae bacterium]|nr:hypothetical protein [Oscillospiraceae bacterium]